MKATAAALLSYSEMTIVTMLGFGNFRHLGPPPSFTHFFFTQSELIEHVSLQATQLGIHFLLLSQHTQLEMQLLEKPD